MRVLVQENSMIVSWGVGEVTWMGGGEGDSPSRRTEVEEG